MTLTFTGSQFTPWNNTNNKGLIGTNMVIVWGDGTSEALTSNSKLPSHTYSTSGTYIIKITGNVTSFENGCFRGITGLKDAIIPSTVTSLKTTCFYGCSSLTSITLPKTCSSIGNSCFFGCSSLTSITLPNITMLSNACFRNCSSLTSINIPNTVTLIDNYCFYGCSKLVDYQLYWDSPPITYDSSKMPNNTNTYWTIPNGTTANYVAKSFPSNKLIERSA